MSEVKIISYYMFKWDSSPSSKSWILNCCIFLICVVDDNKGEKQNITFSKPVCKSPEPLFGSTRLPWCQNSAISKAQNPAFQRHLGPPCQAGPRLDCQALRWGGRSRRASCWSSKGGGTRRNGGVGLYNPPAILDPGNFAGVDRIILDLDKNINFLPGVRNVN